MSFINTTLYEKIKALMIVRLTIVTIILLTGGMFLDVSRHYFYEMIGLSYALTVLYAFALRRRRHLYLLALFQIFSDLLLVTAVIHFSGGLESIYAMLYVVSIISAAFVLSNRETLWTSAAASVLYILLVYGEYYRFLPRYPTGLLLYEDRLSVFHIVYVRATIFCLAGVLTGHLASRLNRMEERIRQSERFSAMGEMAASIAHEIRNPLASITGSVELLMEEISPKGESDRLMRLIIRESDRLHHYMEEYLDFSRPRPARPEKCDLIHLINEVLSIVRIQHRSRREFSVGWGEGESGSIRLWIDPILIKQLFLNLILNGIDAMPKGGRLAIYVEEKPAMVKIWVHDQGIGISQKRLKTLFSSRATTKQKGTGLGLTIAHQIVEQHHGELDVQSYPGRGSIFTVNLPKLSDREEPDATT
jgi:two-component system, NtrC family, sensor histidine kinase HydH